MAIRKEESIERAREDLSERLSLSGSDIEVLGVEEKEFSDMSLGSPEDGEMAAQMIAEGWSIRLGAAGKEYEYRGDKYQLRLHNFNGRNIVII